MATSRRSILWKSGVVLAAALLLGCQTEKQSKSTSLRGAESDPVAPISNTDPCATRLHDICGALLLFYATNDRLPADLTELERAPGSEDIPSFTCPVSNKPYVYNAGGIRMPEKNSWVILYDPAPSHSNLRWAVSILEPVPGQPLVTKVVALPETFFLLRPPK
jgi:hypothetical protein